MKWFSYDPNGDGFVFHDTEQEAREAAEKAVESERDLASDGWSDEVDGICWGEVRQRVMETERHIKREDESHSCAECFYVEYGGCA